MILTALTFLVILTVLVLIHELGHFMMARWIGVRVEEFGLGLPPRIWGKKFGNTIYSLNWLPIGGFVRLAGEDDASSGQLSKIKGKLRPDQRQKLGEYFWARSKKERSVILAAGVIMNFILAVGITAALLVSGVKEPSGIVRVERIVAGSPAEKAGFQLNDTLVSIAVRDQTPMKLTTPAELIAFVNEEKGNEVTLHVVRDGQDMSITVTPRKEVPPGEGPLGVAISDLETHKYTLAEAPGKAFMINIMRAKEMLVSLGSTLWRLVTLRAPEADVAGPIGIAQVTGQAVKFGWQAVLEFASILSLNLAVLNILPIPALDGGRLAFVFLEKILGRRAHPAFEKSTHQIGMIILLGLVLLVSINDILRLVRG
ncbi:RIP metalloprotease RseP [Patescibacteria group bacterium]|nr:RIP metalloprotease RseP [Patescibacteria group bacterium]